MDAASVSSLFPVATSVKEAVDLIILHSFAVLHVQDKASTLQSIQRAWSVAEQFFTDGCRDDRGKHHKIVQGHLHGFHRPSSSKLLFRCFLDSPDQPWPNEEFQESSTTVALTLREMLISCWKEIESRCNEEKASPVNAKRRRLDSSKINEDVPNKRLQMKQCPLDYFFYHGNDPSAINCSEHVDRGVLICVCLSKVPGLELRIRKGNRQSEEFFCPESTVKTDTDYCKVDGGPSGLVCIMAGDQLDESLQVQEIYIPACRHRVRNNLKHPRLSITYELRV